MHVTVVAEMTVTGIGIATVPVVEVEAAAMPSLGAGVAALEVVVAALHVIKAQTDTTYVAGDGVAAVCLNSLISLSNPITINN